MEYLLLLAVLPSIVLLIFVYKMDSYEKEPKGLLFGLFFLGVVSTIPAALLEVLGDFILALFVDEETSIYNGIEAFMVVALIEEGFKFLFMYILTWKNKAFNYKFDGIVYAVFVSLGFATFENILYVADGSVATALLRGVLSIPGHMTDAVFMGYYYGLAKDMHARGKKSQCTTYMWLTLIVPVILHGIYDCCLFIGSGISIIIFFLFVVLIDIISIVRVVRSSKHNAKIYENKKYIFCVECGSQCDYHTFFCGNCGGKLHRLEEDQW